MIESFSYIHLSGSGYPYSNLLDRANLVLQDPNTGCLGGRLEVICTTMELFLESVIAILAGVKGILIDSSINFLSLNCIEASEVVQESLLRIIHAIKFLVVLPFLFLAAVTFWPAEIFQALALSKPGLVEARAPINEHAKAILPLYQNALQNREDPAVRRQLAVYNQHRFLGPRGVKIFEGADFLVQHGAMHATFTALMVPEVIKAYAQKRYNPALTITALEVKALQIGALFHSVGRAVKKSDLSANTSEMWDISAAFCKRYLLQAGFGEALATRVSEAVLYKDDPFRLDKDFFQEVLQCVDSIAVQRKGDGAFQPKRLDACGRFRWVRSLGFQTLVERAREVLLAVGDVIVFGHQGVRIDLAQKSRFEKDPNCYDLMAEVFQRHFQTPIL